MSARCANGHLLGYVETCASCRASREPSEPVDLTPSEVALARVLAAWEAWPGTTEIESDATEGALIELSDVLSDFGFVSIQEDTDNPAVSKHGASLLARARKAGVL